MAAADFQTRVGTITEKVHELADLCYPDFDFRISYLTVFTQSEEDLSTLKSELQQIGQESETNNGYKYTLSSPVNYSGEKVGVVRIRKPDVHRKELGCADLTYVQNDYDRLREIALDKGFDIIVRRDYEMIELSDFNINVYAYLVKEKPS